MQELKGPGRGIRDDSTDDQGLTRRRWLGTALLGPAVLPWLAACQPVPPLPLKLGMNPWVGFDPLVLARERGMADPAAVLIVELTSSSETLRSFRNGLLDAAAIRLDEALRLADEGFDPRLVAVLSESAGGDAVLARSDVNGLDDLRGRTVAVEATTVGALMLKRLLQAAALQESDVRVMNVEATQHQALLRNRRADVAVSFEPLAGALREDGHRVLFDSRQMPGDIVDVLVVSPLVLHSRFRQVQALLDAWRRGLLTLQQEPELSAQLLAPGADLSVADYMAVGQGLRFYSPAESLALIDGAPPALGQASERLALTLQVMGLLRESPDWGRLLTPEPALKARADREAGA